MEILATISSFVTHVKGEQGFVGHHGRGVPPGLKEVRSVCEEAKVDADGGEQIRFDGFSSVTVWREVGQPVGGAASGDAAEFFSVCADTGSDSNRSDDQYGVAEDSADAAWVLEAVRCREAAESAGSEDGDGNSGPGDAGSAVLNRIACLRACWAADWGFGQQDGLRSNHRQGRQRAHCARREESARDGREVSARGAAGVAEEGEDIARPGIVREQPRAFAEPRRSLEDFVGVRAAGGPASTADAAHAAT